MVLERNKWGHRRQSLALHPLTCSHGKERVRVRRLQAGSLCPELLPGKTALSAWLSANLGYRGEGAVCGRLVFNPQSVLLSSASHQASHSVERLKDPTYRTSDFNSC